jgi:dTDP-4-amino-4,6-dideoxygalactose transaminase
VLNVRPEDEAIVPADTFTAAKWARAYTGANVPFCDYAPDTWEIVAHSLKGSITPRTKAVMGVHLYGSEAR